MSSLETAPAMSGERALRLVGLGALIGIPAALAAALFLAAVHELEHWFWVDLPEHLGASGPSPWYLVVGLPLAGASIVLAARTLLPGDGGHEPLGGIAVAPTPISHAPGVALAAIGSLAFGAVLGPEAPLFALGSVVGLVAARFARLGEADARVRLDRRDVLGDLGPVRGPVAAATLLLEAGVGMGALLIPILIPGLVAASIGYLIFLGIGDWGGLEATTLSSARIACLRRRPSPRPRRRPRGRCSAGPAHRGRPAAGGADRRPWAGAARSAADAAAGSARGSVSWRCSRTGSGRAHRTSSSPGEASIPGLVGEDSARIVIVLLAAKALAYAICLGCGFRGGPVFPAIFLGVAVAMVAAIAFGMSPTLALAVGTAAGMTAMTRLILASLIIAALLVGTAGVEVVPVAALAAVAAWLTMAAIDMRFQPVPPRRSLGTASFRRAAGRCRERSARSVLR